MLLYTDVYESPEKNSEFLQKVMQLTVPILLVINKIDLSSQDELTTIVEAWEKRMPNVEIIPCSALTKFNVAYILKRISALLPEGEPYYDTDTLTDKPTRFFVSEIIREKILMLYKKEIPYSVEVLVEDFIEEAKHIHIRAVVFVARESQKGIIIGNKGAGIKRLHYSTKRY